MKYRYHDGNDDGISHMVAKGLKPTRAIFFERIPFEESSVKCVCVVNGFLEAFQGDLGRGGRTSQVPEETIKAVGPGRNDDILYFRYFLLATCERQVQMALSKGRASARKRRDSELTSCCSPSLWISSIVPSPLVRFATMGSPG
jgi:hypothetical protein